MLGGCARLGPARMTHTPGLRRVRLDSQGPGSDAVRQVSFLVPGPLPCPLPGSISFFSLTRALLRHQEELTEKHPITS